VQKRYDILSFKLHEKLTGEIMCCKLNPNVLNTYGRKEYGKNEANRKEEYLFVMVLFIYECIRITEDWYNGSIK